MTKERKTHWDEVYENRDDTALSWFQQDVEPSLGLIRRHMPSKSAAIVDVGAGASRLVDGLLDCGYRDITLVDISSRALERTAQRLGERGKNVGRVTADVTGWTPERTWQVWHDRAVFHFLTEPADQDAYLKALRLGTIGGSLVVLGTFAPDAPEKCSGLPVRRYSAAALQERLGDGYEQLENLRDVHVTPAGRSQPFTFTVFRRL